jgi:lipopolysaccharide transport system ATP-binding protein
MSRPIIEVRNLSKRYHLGAIGATSIREQFHRYWDRLRGIPHPDPQEFWALRDVSFDVQPGEVVGVIGRNGAGKSTLLKILSRITEPTTGSARLRGRVASLLEVGTGFHPELTGRENIFLNGAILGMTRAEVRRKFDEIVAFAEVDTFIDTPVKRYSSGMYVRLAFAVAAHLEPEILIIDEVLAVGDAAFQRKCMGKIDAVAHQDGRTVIFVTHNMQAMRQLCSRALLLAHGNTAYVGDTGEAADLYFGKSSINAACLRPHDLDEKTRPAMISEIAYANRAGEPAMRIDRSDSLVVKLSISARSPLSAPRLSMALIHADGHAVFSETAETAQFGGMLPAGEHELQFELEARYLKCESYYLTLFLFDGAVLLDEVQNVPVPVVEDAAADLHAESTRWGLVRIPILWHRPAPRKA